MSKPNKFASINKNKRDVVTHSDIQEENERLKNRPKQRRKPLKSDDEKLASVISLNLTKKEDEILTKEAKAIGLNVISLTRVSLANALSSGFLPDKKKLATKAKDEADQRVVKQYGVNVTSEIKEQVIAKSKEYMVSVSQLLKMALVKSGYLDIR